LDTAGPSDVLVPVGAAEGVSAAIALAAPGPREDQAQPQAEPAEDAERSEAELPPLPPAREPCFEEGLLLCETFEGAASGSFPATDPWLAELPGCGTHVVEESGVSVSGVRALRANSGGYPECMLHAELGRELGEETDLYIRSWVRLGPEPELREVYLSLLELGPRESQDEPELRIGLRPSGGSLCEAAPGLDVSVSGIGGGSATDCSGVVLEPERWYCLQAHVTRAGQRLGVSLAVDGESVLEQEYERLGRGWDAADSYLKLGQAAYGPSARGAVWHDDVAVGRQPLSCAP